MEIEKLIMDEDIISLSSDSLSMFKNLKVLDMSQTKITQIPKYTFGGSSTINEIVLPSCLRVINDLPSRITEIYIPATVEKIDPWAWGFWSRVQKIEVDENNPFFSSVDGVLYNKEQTKLISYPACRGVERVELLPTVTSLSECAFRSVKASEIVLPNKIKTIPGHCFLDCNVDKIVFPSKLQSVGICAFESGQVRKGIRLPDSVKRIGARAFAMFQQEEMVLPSKMVEVSEKSFVHSNIKTIIIPEGVTKVCQCAINGCDVENVLLPSTLFEIEEAAIAYCSKLRSLHIPDSVNSIHPDAFAGLSATISIGENPYYTVIDNKVVSRRNRKS